MGASGLDAGDSNIKLEVSDRFEINANEETVLPLNSLCDPCTSFLQKSAIIQRLGRKIITVQTKEFGHVGSPAQLKDGYKTGKCHLCALLWARAGGYLLDPDKPIRPNIDTKNPVKVELLARDVEIEYQISIKGKQTGAKAFWQKLTMPAISEDGLIQLRIDAVRRDIYADLHIHHSSNPKLNQDSLRVTESPISSRHEVNYEPIKNWVSQCIDNHSKCREFQQLVAPASQFPSRLLDVSDNKIRLECGVDNLPPDFRYTTLSHMWGPDPSACPQLERAQLEPFSKDIPIEMLPGKYADAIRLTRALGFRYIWIDSLCIVQDWPEDWAKEAVKMASVYGRSSVNISYTFPPADEKTKKYLRDPRVQLPCRVPFTKPSKNGEDALIIQHRPGLLRPSWSPTVYKRIWPLLSRCWVFQERLLCCRTVYYGQGRLLWECCDGIIDEFYGPLTTSNGSKDHFHRIITGISKSFSSQVSVTPATEASPTSGPKVTHEVGEKTNAQSQWGPLVRDYRAGDLTQEGDRGIAFLGIVRAVQSSSGGTITYLAGLWKELFAYDLLWSVNSIAVDEEKFLTQKGKTKPAPSWSWFSIPIIQTKLGSDILDFPFRTTMQIYPVWTAFQAEVLAWKHPRAEENKDLMLHDFAGLSVTIKTKKIKIGWDWWQGMCYALPHGQEKWVLGAKENIVSGQRIVPRVLKYAHDDPLLKEGDEMPANACLLLAVEQMWHTDVTSAGKLQYPAERGSDKELGEQWKTSYQWAGIVVVPEGDEGAWRRIGAVMFFDHISGQRLESPWDGVEEEDIELV